MTTSRHVPDNRENRLAGIIEACRKHNIRSQATLVRSIQHSFHCTRETAIDYVKTLLRTNELTWRNGYLKPNDNEDGGNTEETNHEP